MLPRVLFVCFNTMCFDLKNSSSSLHLQSQKKKNTLPEHGNKIN